MMRRRTFIAAALAAPALPLGSALARPLRSKPSRPTSSSYKPRRA